MWLGPYSNLQANFIVKAQTKYYHISFSALSERIVAQSLPSLGQSSSVKHTLDSFVSHTSHLIPQKIWQPWPRNAFSSGRAIKTSYLILVISNSGPNGFLSFHLVDNSPFPMKLPQRYEKDNKFYTMSYSKFFKVLSSHTEEQKLLHCHMRLNDHYALSSHKCNVFWLFVYDCLSACLPSVLMNHYCPLNSPGQLLS